MAQSLSNEAIFARTEASLKTSRRVLLEVTAGDITTQNCVKRSLAVLTDSRAALRNLNEIASGTSIQHFGRSPDPVE